MNDVGIKRSNTKDMFQPTDAAPPPKQPPSETKTYKQSFSFIKPPPLPEGLEFDIPIPESA